MFGKDRNDVIGLLFTKDLIFIDPDDETPLENFVDIFGRSVTVRQYGVTNAFIVSTMSQKSIFSC